MGLVLQTLAGERDEALNRIQGGRLAAVLHGYVSARQRVELTPKVEALLAERMLHAETGNLRVVNFRSFTNVAQTPMALEQVKALLDGKLTVPGMALKPLDRWNLVGDLIAMGDPEAVLRYAAEQARDQSGEGQKYAYAVEAGKASVENKDFYFNDYFHNAARQEDWITQSLRGFKQLEPGGVDAAVSAACAGCIADHQAGAANLLSNGVAGGVSRRGSRVRRRWAVVHEWLGAGRQAGLDQDLRLKVLEAVDGLERKVAIKRRFAD